MKKFVLDIIMCLNFIRMLYRVVVREVKEIMENVNLNAEGTIVQEMKK